ncbi:MAG: hypothetical protein HY236_04020 [Acidobacteria bacterium]|nr:hypothetical protein [Acidobacteriota bacterium]
MGHPFQSLDLVPSSSLAYQWSGGITLRDVAAVLFRRKKIIAVLFLSIFAGVSLGEIWVWPYLSPPRFGSELKFIIKKDRFDAVITPAERAVPGLTTTVEPQEVYSEIELLRSADVVERLAREARVTPDPVLLGHRPETDVARSVGRLQRGLVVEPVVVSRNVTNLISVRYSSPDAAEVSRVLNRLPEIYLEKHLGLNRRPGALEYFRSQAEACERQLKEAEDQLAEFEKQQPVWSAEGGRLPALEELVEVGKQRFETEAAIREAESRAAELARQWKALPLMLSTNRAAVDSAYLERLKAQLVDLENRRAQATFYREIGHLDRRIREVGEAIQRELKMQETRIESGEPNPARSAVEAEQLRSQVLLAGLKARRASLLEQERAAREQAAAFRRFSAESAAGRAELVRNVRSAEENFSLYRKKYAEAREAEALNERRVLNVALAEGPRAPAPVPRRNQWFSLAVGFLLAAVGGAAGGFAGEALDHSIHTPRQLEHYSSLAVLASIPESRQG